MRIHWLRAWILSLCAIALSALPVVAQTSGAQTSGAVQTGTYSLSATPRALIGGQADSYAGVAPVDRPVTFVVHVPPAYDPASPPGILAYISPTETGDLPQGWATALDAANLIWISADDSGNKVETRRRVYDVILALALVRQHYAVTPARIYLSGFSGGGRSASILAMTAPQLFNGAIYMGGANDVKPENAALAERSLQNRYVFITGRDDFNEDEMKRVHAAYVKRGIPHVKWLDLPTLGHTTPPAADLTTAIDFLDGRDATAPGS